MFLAELFHNVGILEGSCTRYNRGHARPGLNELDMLSAYGITPVLLSRWADGLRLPKRVPGPDVLKACLDAASRRGLNSFFLGDTEERLSVLREELPEHVPGDRIAGTLAPPFRPVGRDEELEMVGKVNRGSPELLWVALGTPRQERSVGRNRVRPDVPLIAGWGRPSLPDGADEARTGVGWRCGP